MGQNEKYLQNPADELSEKEQIIEATLFSKQLKLINWNRMLWNGKKMRRFISHWNGKFHTKAVLLRENWSIFYAFDSMVIRSEKKLRSCDTIHENDIKANKVNKNARKKAILVISVFVFNFNIISMTENEHKKKWKEK